MCVHICLCIYNGQFCTRTTAWKRVCLTARGVCVVRMCVSYKPVGGLIDKQRLEAVYVQLEPPSQSPIPYAQTTKNRRRTAAVPTALSFLG